MEAKLSYSRFKVDVELTQQELFTLLGGATLYVQVVSPGPANEEITVNVKHTPK